MADQVPRDLRRSLIARERGQGRRLPPQLRAQAESWACRQLAAGTGVTAVARALQVAPETVRRWVASRPTATAIAFVPVEIIADEATTTAASCTLAVVAPGGYRVEGLTIVGAAALLRALR